MNIAIINQWYPPKSYGGVAAYNYYLSKALADAGHKVFMITKSNDREECHELKDGIRIYRIRHFDFHYYLYKIPFIGKNLRLIRNIIYSFFVCRKIKELDALEQIDIIEYTAEIETEGILHPFKINIPFIVKCQTPFFLLQKYYTSRELKINCLFMKMAEKYFIKKANAIASPTFNLANEIAKECNISENSIQVIPDIIDIDQFKPTRKKIDGNKIIILFVGRMERGKGIFVLAQAIPEIIKKNTNIKFIYIGSDRPTETGGSSIEDLKIMLNDSGAMRSVEIKGATDDKNLAEHYQSSDIFINPSLIYESFSYTNVQAMAYEKPVIASRIGGIPEVVLDGETGILFEPGNIQALAGAMLKLINNTELRVQMGLKGRKRVEQSYSAIKVAEENIKLYKKVVMQCTMKS